MWAQGLATSLYTHRPKQKARVGVGREHRDGGIKRDIQTETFKHFDCRNKLTIDMHSLESFPHRASAVIRHSHMHSQREGGKGSTMQPKGETHSSIPGECSTYSKRSVMTNHVREVGDRDGRDTPNQNTDVCHKIVRFNWLRWPMFTCGFWSIHCTSTAQHPIYQYIPQHIN